MADAESPFFTKEPNPLDTQVGGGHYKKWKIQPLEFVELNGLSWFGFVILKYLVRIESDTTDRSKKIQDLDKIIHYCKLKQMFLSDNNGNNIQHDHDSQIT